MRKIILTILAAALLAVGFPMQAQAANPTNIFVVAHQDDELLMMGADIARHAAQPGKVIVVLATDGGASAARHKLAAKLGYTPTVADFVTHRDFEFTWTCRALGADVCEIYQPRIPDGKMTFEAAKGLFNSYAKKYPGARFKTHSWLDWHTDHRYLGEALDSLRAHGVINDARFYIRHDYGIGKAPFPLPPHGKPIAPVGDTEQNAYRLWAPNKAHNRYWGIGYLSTASLFNAHRANPRSFVHASSVELGQWPGAEAAHKWIVQNSNGLMTTRAGSE